MNIFCLFTVTSLKPIVGQGIQIEEDWISQIALGDMDAFQILYQKTDKALFGYLLSILKNQYDAEDVMQDTYLRIKASAHLYQPKGKPMAWIFTIGRNLALMKLRKDKRTSYTNYEDLENQIEFASITNMEDRLVLESAFKILNDKERQIIIMYAVTGMKHREIAAILDMPLSSVLSKYNRALGKLKKNLLGNERLN